MALGRIIHIRIYASFEELMVDRWLGGNAVGGPCQVYVFTTQGQLCQSVVWKMEFQTYKAGMCPR